MQNRQFRLAERPQGLPRQSDWHLTREPVGEPGDGEILVGIQYISLDPAMRGWMNAGRLQHREDIVEGFETFPQTFLKLFSGDKFGKLVLKVESA